jgi:anaerobic magnesium-protoporphyrin IX monomethyl ester cyclase
MWGWPTTEKALRAIDVPVVGYGGPTVWVDENLRLARLIKEINPNVVNVFGGPHATLAPETLIFPGSPIDVVVYGEGEYTMLELMNECRKPDSRRDFSTIRGLVYLKNRKPHYTEPRPLIEDLDSLPDPAYHLLPMDRYGHPRGMWGRCITVYHSKGCIDNCRFCTCWVSGGDFRGRTASGEWLVSPRYRTRSAKRVCDELTYLRDTYKRDFFLFTDDTWNVSPKWQAEWVSEYNAHGLEAGWFAFMRADFIFRDIQSGLFKQIYEGTGLRHIIVGIERSRQQSLDGLSKHTKVTHSEYLVRWLRQHCPEMFIQGTFINGLWEDRPEDFTYQADFAKRIGIDYPGFHALTPFPGTTLYDEYQAKGLIDPAQPFEDFEFDRAIVPTKYMTKAEVTRVNRLASIKFAADPIWLLRGLFSKGTVRKRIYRHFLKSMISFIASHILKMQNPFKFSPTATQPAPLFNEVEPEWYHT